MMNLKKRIIQKIKYELGLNELEAETKSLLFILNHCVDITQIPPTRDQELRLLQKCDTMLLAIFDKLCSKYKLDYWLNYGTLLGAYRHKGFIPWDDDIDITMPREHLNKVMALMKDDYERFGMTIRYAVEHPLRCLVLGYNEEKTGVWIDIFPDDNYSSGATEAHLIEAMKEYRSFYDQHRFLDSESLTKKKDQIFMSLPKGDTKYLMSLLEGWMGEPYIINKPSDIYPIKRGKFEGFDLCVPNNMQLLIERRYGKNYLELPRFAINNHGRPSDITVAQRAKANGIDMEEVYRHLKSIYDSLLES